MTEETKPLNLYQRISAVMADVTSVGKGANVDGRYDAVRHDDVTDMLRPLMVKHGIISTIDRVESSVVDLGMVWGGKRAVSQMRALFRVVYINIDNPEETVKVLVEAHADEVGDKAPGKVMSYAQKYADLKLFRVPTGEDEEQRLDETKLTEPTLTEDHLIELQQTAEELFGDDADAVLQSMATRVFRVNSYLQILDKHAGVALQKLRNKAASEKG